MPQKQKKRIFKIGLLLGTIISLFFVPWAIIWTWILPLPNTIQAQVEEAIDHGFSGAIVYVDQTGKPPALYAAGWHDRKNKIPANPKALFKIASINKLYVAVAITKLAHDKQLSLDKTVADYFPELVGRIEHAERITIRMLVQHKSGIPNYTNVQNYWAAPKETNTEKLELILDQPASFLPGEGYEYSNTNYLLLSELMDKVLGYDNFKFIQAQILNPLNLKHTFRSLKEVHIEDVMSGYHVGYEPDLKTDNQGMLATAEDVGIFLRALNDGSLFKEGEQDIYSSIYVYDHTGLVPGYQSIAKYHKDIDAVVILFTSTTNFEGYHWNIAEIVYNRVLKILKK